MTKMMTFHLPEKDVLAAIGEVALWHENLNHILRMTIKTLARLEVDEALDATEYDGSSYLRDRVKKLARQRLGEGTPLLKLQALIERCKRATDHRNELIHSVWARELDDEQAHPVLGRKRRPPPTISELQSLAEQIKQLTEQLNEARLQGFLHEALTSKLKAT